MKTLAMPAVGEQLDLEERLRRPVRGEPVWPLAKRFPLQGTWTVDDYLTLVTDRGAEYVEGCVEFLPMPTEFHQWVAGFLYRHLFDAITGRGLGRVYQAGYKVSVPDGLREPDVVCVLNENAARIGQQFTAAADLVVEVVSPNDPRHDWVTKRAEYAAAGIPEYWIADPRDRTLTILTLDPGATEYREAGRHCEGETARSVLLDGLTVDVTAVFAAD